MVFPRFDLDLFCLERSGRSVGFISANSHTYKSSWCRVMTEETKSFLKFGFPKFWSLDTGFGQF